MKLILVFLHPLMTLSYNFIFLLFYIKGLLKTIPLKLRNHAPLTNGKRSSLTENKSLFIFRTYTLMVQWWLIQNAVSFSLQYSSQLYARDKSARNQQMSNTDLQMEFDEVKRTFHLIQGCLEEIQSTSPSFDFFPFVCCY